ncbi:hypothetical protein I4U23_012293 [Adineta vaga]|nr:hypothetical protein I4U23_012293 [Adineta vaga]
MKELQRADYDDHIKNECNKTKTSCPAADMKYLWAEICEKNLLSKITANDSFIIAMFPSNTKSYVFNENAKQEWQISHDTNVQFVIYGKNLNGSILSFTIDSESCSFERKNHSYILTTSSSNSDQTIIEQVFLTINLPYYSSTLYICLQSRDVTQPSHQGDRPTLKLNITRLAIPVWATILLLILLLCLSSLFSGLNLGLMSLTPHDLIVIQEAGTPTDRVYAKKIYPVRKRGNFLLCTILLGNVLVNSITTILLDTLIHGILAVAGATLAIVIFGEIIPQAICSRHGLKVGAKTIILTQFFMILTFPVAFPLSKLLDLILGEEVGATYTRDQMSVLLKHTVMPDIEESERKIMTGVLSLKAKKIRDIMTNLIDVFMLEADQIVDDELILTVHGYGYSRIPVYDKQRENIIGLVNFRDFAVLDTEFGKFTVRNVMTFYNRRYAKMILPDESCYDIFSTLKREQYHMGVVVELDTSSEKDPKPGAIGIVTLEDIIEEMIQEEIVDETDVFTDNRRRVRNILSQAPNFSAFMRQPDATDDTTNVSAQMKVAIFQFLSITVQPFTSRFMSSDILIRLLNTHFYQQFDYDEDKNKKDNPTYIYEYGKPVDYFVLILNGQAELVTGKEKIVSIVGPFSYFGVSALLCDSSNQVEGILHAKDHHVRPFVPDFGLRVCENLQILRIRRKHWLAAVRADFLEKKQKSDRPPSIPKPGGKQIDFLTQELEKADCVYQLEASIKPSTETNDKIRDRAISFTPLVNSTHVPTEEKKSVGRRSSSFGLQRSDKTLPESSTTTTTEDTHI